MFFFHLSNDDWIVVSLVEDCFVLLYFSVTELLSIIQLASFFSKTSFLGQFLFGLTYFENYCRPRSLAIIFNPFQFLKVVENFDSQFISTISIKYIWFFRDPNFLSKESFYSRSFQNIVLSIFLISTIKVKRNYHFPFFLLDTFLKLIIVFPSIISVLYINVFGNNFLLWVSKNLIYKN